MTATVSAIRCADYGDGLYDAVKRLLAPLGGMESFVKPGQKVLLKANLLSPAPPEKAITTHPALVKVVARLVRECGGVCFVGDGPGVGTTSVAARTSGIAAAAESEGAKLLEFQETATYHNADNRILKNIDLTAHLQEMDVLITLPKCKTHCQMGFTGALKNQYGLIPGTAKGQFHFRFQNRDRLADLMIDINRTAHPVLAIMDAITAMEGMGPGSGTPRHLGVLLASSDLAAVDAVACAAIHLPLTEVPVSQAAIRAGFGTSDLQNIDIVGDSLESFSVADFKLAGTPVNIMRIVPLPGWMLRWLRRQFMPAPRINPDKCIRCGRCEDGCPVKPAAITPKATDGKTVHDGRCIRCYCCHEFCPVKAIDLKKSLLARIVPFTALGNFGTKVLGWCCAIFFRKGGRKS